MRPRTCCLAAALLLASNLPVLAADGKDDPKERLIPTGKVVGRLSAVGHSDQSITVQVVLRYVEPYVSGRTVRLRLRQLTQDVSLRLADEVKVRLRQPPPAYDDKGYLRKYTRAELRELKGEANLPGYTGGLTDLAVGQTVQIHMAQKRSELVARRGKNQEEWEDKRPWATMVVILAEPQS